MSLNRSLGLPMLTFYGTGMILGAGIYSIIGKAAGLSGESLWLSFLLAGAAATLTALSYAELATMFPTAGAEYIYLRHAFPNWRWVSTTIGFTVLFAGFSSASAVALAFGSYMQHFIELPRLFFAYILLIAFTGLNILGIRQSSWTNAAFTLIEGSGLVLFIWLGLQNPDFGKALMSAPNLGTISSASLIIFAFLGFENIVSLAEETKLPEKNIPRAILLSLAIAISLYVLVSLAAVALMNPELLAQTDSALIDASIGTSPKIAGILGGIALFSTANTTLIGLITTSRIMYGISKDQSLPKILSKTMAKQQTPWVAALTALVCSCILLMIGKVETLAGIASFTTMIVFIFVNIALIRLRFSLSEKKRPFQIPITIKKFPITALLAIGICGALLLQFDKFITTTGLLALLGSYAFYFFYKWKSQ